MDALEFYIGELEAALNRPMAPAGEARMDRFYAIEQAAYRLITAWDAENSPERDHDGYSVNEECGARYARTDIKDQDYVCNAGPDHSGDHVALNSTGTEIVAHWRRTETNPKAGRVIQITAPAHAVGTYRVDDSQWGFARRLSDNAVLQINWDAVEWEYES